MQLGCPWIITHLHAVAVLITMYLEKKSDYYLLRLLLVCEQK
jgi:hypothetical protein